MMKTLIKSAFTVLFISIFVAGCKLDPPVYPEGTVINIPGSNNGNNSGDTDVIGLPIGAVGAVKVQVDGGDIMTYDGSASFNVTAPDATSATGSIAVQALKGIEPIILSIEASTAGTQDLAFLGFSVYSTVNGPDVEKGKVQITLLNATEIQGSFKTNVTDLQNQPHQVIGSFNIKK
ncbi:hypothetical protein ACFQZX_06670 [Mucilaginibacter litoreus]|uniref:Lipoprotein n=1 Tax=Mucilaginibacter litoreus TaxID=1048221 RepID=A0ABW3AR12_9SPHI